MKSQHSIPTMILCVLFLIGCSPASTAETAPTGMPPAAASSAPSLLQFETVEIPDALSLSIAGNANGDLYLAYGIDHSLYVSRSMDAGRTFSEAVLATGDSQAHVLPVERPALAVGGANLAGVAWLELAPDFQGANIWYAESEDGGASFKPAILAGTEPAGEVAMVQLAYDGNGNPYLAWLNGSLLKFARSFDGGESFTSNQRIPGGACECCQPQMVILDDGIYIAYRGLESGGTNGDIRDILLVHSKDGGETFEPFTRVSDQHWYLPACPIAGPSMAIREDTFFIAWMDGRFEPADAFRRGDAWFASSADKGVSFSPNVRINPDQEAHHTLPSIAIGPGGRIHAAWESLSQSGGGNNLLYTVSDDGGQTFSQPQVIADNRDDSLGNPGKAVLHVDAMGNVTLAWLDRSGAHVAAWIDTR